VVLRRLALWTTQVGFGVHIVVDLANGPPNTVSWAQTSLGDLQLFKFNATGVVVGDISVVCDACRTNVAGKHRNLQRGRHRVFQFRISCTTCGDGLLGSPATWDFTIVTRRLRRNSWEPHKHLRCRRIQRSNWQQRAGDVGLAVPGPCCRRWHSRPDLGERWPSRLGGDGVRKPPELSA
jgi:hypothetical protein